MGRSVWTFSRPKMLPGIRFLLPLVFLLLPLLQPADAKLKTNGCHGDCVNSWKTHEEFFEVMLHGACKGLPRCSWQKHLSEYSNSHGFAIPIPIHNRDIRPGK